MKKRFKVGVANTDIDLIMTQKDLIHSFFIGLPITGNCRSNYIQMDILPEFLEKCEDVPVWVTANMPFVYPKDLERTIDMLYSTWKTYKFHGYIACDIVLLQELKNRGIPVQVSTVADIRDLNDVHRYYEMGFDDLVLSYKANRNLDFINECVKYFPEVKFTLITNELCESNCPHRYAHFCMTSQNTHIKYHCPIRIPKDTDERRLKLLQNTMIPPENLEYYPESIIFKLPTRMLNFSAQNLVKHLRTYAGIRPYKNIYKLVHHHINISKMGKFKVDKAIFEHWLNCKNQCYNCDICASEIRRLKTEKVKGLFDDSTTVVE
jgi:hypothetical protein